MAVDAEIRRENFRRLWPKPFSPKDAVERLGKTESYWSDLYRGPKSFGEKTARRIEEALSLPRLSLDEPQGARSMPIASDILHHIENLGPEERAKVDAVLRAHLGLSAESVSRKRAGLP